MSIHYDRKLFASTTQQSAAAAYIRPEEVIDANEDEVIAIVRDATVADTRRLPRHSGKSDAAFHETHWGHTTGLLQGTLAIDRIEALPAPFRVGLFERNASYPVLSRPNVVHDRRAGFAFGRLAMKLKYPSAVPNVYAPGGEAHELDLLFGEGSPELNGPGHTFFFRDACELALFTTLLPPSLKTLQTVLALRNLPVIVRVFKRLSAVTGYANSLEARKTGWAGKHYFCAGPFALGDGAMKFCLRPRQAHAIEPSDPKSGDPTKGHRDALRAWIAAGKDAVFDLCVQLATPACIPEPRAGGPSKRVMTAEYCDLQWDEAKSPYIAVGTLTFPAAPQHALNETFPWSPLQFNAWNTLPSMRPLGQAFRARKHTHKANSEARLEHLYDAKPGAMVDKAPFGA